MSRAEKPSKKKRRRKLSRFERARREILNIERLVGPNGLRQFMCYVPESMRERLLARRDAQDAALEASRASRPASGPENA